MISNKTKSMSTQILSFDSALLWPSEQSFFNDDCPQTQHCSEITPQLASDDWFQEFEDIKSLAFGLELDLNNEPELSLEAMTKEVDIQYQSKADINDYLDSTAFLSPVSTEPSSPQTSDGYTVEYSDRDTISMLEEILSANSSDSEYVDNELDSELNIQSITEVLKEEVESTPSSPETPSAPKRQCKRKAQQLEGKPNKRSKTTVTERKERKRNQNKSAANRYRQKKKAELDTIEQQSSRLLEINNRLKAELQKLQTEFKVVHPLAKMAFAANPQKALELQFLDIRVIKENLLIN